MRLDQLVARIKKSSQHNYLYHFTDVANLASIGEHGLLSKAMLEAKEVSPKKPGGNEWSHDADKAKGIFDYVSLCFTTSHPMCHTAQIDGRIGLPRYLRISPEILFLKGVKLTFDVANKRGVEVCDLEERLGDIDFEVIYRRTDWKDSDIQTRLRAAEKCEILVPRRVPKRYIKGLS